MKVLVDSSVWIDYFKSGSQTKDLDILIDENLIVLNDLILTELIPSLKIKKQREIIRLLGVVEKIDLNIEWSELANFQIKCLKNGINGVGIPDLIIAQNSIQNSCKVYSLDKHFKHLSNLLKIKLHVMG